MDGRDLLSYFDAADDFHPIAVMTPRGLRVVEVTNSDESIIYFEFPSANPNDYRVGVDGSGIALVEPYERLLASDPPYLIMPLLRAYPDEDPVLYEGALAIVNAAGLITDGWTFESNLPAVHPGSFQIYIQD